MPLSPVAQHRIGNLVGIANRPRQRLYRLVSALARTTIRIFCLVLAHAPATITRLALLHDPLSDPIVREALESLRVRARQIRVSHWRLSIERWIERYEQNSDRADIPKCLYTAAHRRTRRMGATSGALEVSKSMYGGPKPAKTSGGGGIKLPQFAIDRPCPLARR